MTSTFTPSGYLETATDQLEWTYIWSEIAEKTNLSNYKNLFTTDQGAWLFGGVDCQSTPLELATNDYCRYNWTNLL